MPGPGCPEKEPPIARLEEAGRLAFRSSSDGLEDFGMKKPATSGVVCLATQAMGCRFEIVLPGNDSLRLHSIGQEVLEEIRLLDRQLSFHSEFSEVSHINREAGSRPVPVEPRLFELISRCRDIWCSTRGAFDPTVTPLLDLWGWQTGEGRVPGRRKLAVALELVGMDKVELDPARRTIRFLRRGMSLNLASVGKGYALDRAFELLAELRVEGAMIHGGSSSVRAQGGARPGEGWRIGVSGPGGRAKVLVRASLNNSSLGVSGNHLNYLSAGDRKIGHIVDPRTGCPVREPILAAVVMPSATAADACSTALLCTGVDDAPWQADCLGTFLARESNGVMVWETTQGRRIEGDPLWH